jgi:hypothetical protein
MGKKCSRTSYDPATELAKGATLTAASYDTIQQIAAIADKVTVGGKAGTVGITGIATGQHDASIKGTLSLWLSIFRYMRPDGTIDHVAGWNIFIQLKAGQTAIESAETFVSRINSGPRPYRAAASGRRERAEITIVFYNK